MLLTQWTAVKNITPKDRVMKITRSQVRVLVTQSCPNLYDPMDRNPPDSSLLYSPGKITE